MGTAQRGEIQRSRGNVFEVQFGSEGDWKHALNNGPWQYDFNALILKEYEENVRPSEMVFDKIEVWVQVRDLPPGKRTKAFGEALGNWLGEGIKVDVHNEGRARGQHLRVRTRILVYEPLVRGFYLKSSLEDKGGQWFNFHYEKIPHFCFECGWLVHVNGVCEPPVDSTDQWGGWLRASPGRGNTVKEGNLGAAASSSNSFASGRTGESENHHAGQPVVREVPTKRNLNAQFARSADSRTGAEYRPRREEVSSPNKPREWEEGLDKEDLRHGLEQRREKDLRSKLVEQQKQRESPQGKSWDSTRRDTGSFSYPQRQANSRWADGTFTGRRQDDADRRRGTYRRKPRQDYFPSSHAQSHAFEDNESRKRRTKQMWVVKDGQGKHGEQEVFIRDTSQKTGSVFERISEENTSSADPDRWGPRSP